MNTKPLSHLARDAAVADLYAIMAPSPRTAERQRQYDAAIADLMANGTDVQSAEVRDVAKRHGVAAGTLRREYGLALKAANR